MRRLALILGSALSLLGLTVAAEVLAQQAPNASPIPLQWNVSIPSTTGTTTATYPGNVAITGLEIYAQYTVATLPTCNANLKGANAAVTDATAPTYNGALTGGGAVNVPVYCNGSSWTSH